MSNPTVAQKVLYFIKPTDVDGNAVDLDSNPLALTDIVFSVDAPAVASLVKVDNLNYYLVPNGPGTVTVSVKGTNVLGQELTSTQDPITFDDVVAPPPPVPVVTSLGLTVGETVSK